MLTEAWTRLYVGLGCATNRALSRHYLVKAILSPTGSDECKAAAHGVLISWNVKQGEDSLRSRYLFAGAYHANEAAILCRKIAPSKDVQSSPAVLHFMFNVFERFSAQVPQLHLSCKDGVQALEERKAQLAEEDAEMDRKRTEKPNRYQCANKGCGVGANTGKMLSQCKTFLYFTVHTLSTDQKTITRRWKVRFGQKALVLQQGLSKRGLAAPQTILQAWSAVFPRRSGGRLVEPLQYREFLCPFRVSNPLFSSRRIPNGVARGA